jgi:hypothetical protein
MALNLEMNIDRGSIYKINTLVPNSTLCLILMSYQQFDEE